MEMQMRMRGFILNTLRLLTLLSIPVVIGLSSTASAVNVFSACNGEAAKTDVCQNINPGKPGPNPIINALKVTITILSIFIGIAAVIMIIVAGLAMITSNGDAQAVAKARGGIIYALIGLVIVAIAQTLVIFVLDKV